jgi:hypothetical protein
MRFKKNWDKTLKYYYNLISETYCYNILISSRIPWFTKDEEGKEIYHDNGPGTIAPIHIWNESIRALKPDILEKDDNIDHWNGKEYAESHFVCGHFMFGSNEFFKKIIPDPRVIFFGEEHTFALRAWTNDFRIFTLKESVLFHLGKTPEYNKKTELNNTNWHKFQLAKGPSFNNINIYKDILMGKEFGPLAAKDKESYIEYLKAIGFDYRTGEEFN